MLKIMLFWHSTLLFIAKTIPDMLYNNIVQTNTKITFQNVFSISIFGSSKNWILHIFLYLQSFDNVFLGPKWGVHLQSKYPQRKCVDCTKKLQTIYQCSLGVVWCKNCLQKALIRCILTILVENEFSLF